MAEDSEVGNLTIYCFHKYLSWHELIQHHLLYTKLHWSSLKAFMVTGNKDNQKRQFALCCKVTGYIHKLILSVFLCNFFFLITLPFITVSLPLLLFHFCRPMPALNPAVFLGSSISIYFY